MNYKMTLQYDGTRYSGWQRQGNTEKTIQGKLEQAISTLLEEPVEIHGSGRTDAGVHALGQVASFQTGSPIPDCGLFQRALNERLPGDIAVTVLTPASPRFHARLNAKEKTYRYTVWNSDIPNVLERRYLLQVPEILDLSRMEDAAARMLGTHDFSGFSADKTKKSTVRHLKSVELHSNGPRLELLFTGNGFLRSMVRILTGTLLEVGMGKREPESVDQVFQSQSRQDAGFTAPPQGLCLIQVIY